MGSTLFTIRVIFFLICLAGGILVYSTGGSASWPALLYAPLIAALAILTDLLLRGFSTRGLTSLTFGLFLGWVTAHFINDSPLFDKADEETKYIFRLCLFCLLTYWGAVIALRGSEDFHVVIPFVRFVPHGVDIPVVVVDTTVLLDGRLPALCASKFFSHALVIPRFVVDELTRIADSSDASRQARGRKGLDGLNQLRQLSHVDLRLDDTPLGKGQKRDDRIVFIAQSLKAKLLTSDYNLARVAEFNGVECLNLRTLDQALHRETVVGDIVEVNLTKSGKEQGQAVGYLQDGSMVVVPDSHRLIGQRVTAEVDSIIPTAGGRMIFARLQGEADSEQPALS